MAALQVTGTLVNRNDLVTLGGPDATPAMTDQSTCCVELIGTLTAGTVVFEVAGPLSSTWYTCVCWNKTTPNQLQASATAPGMYVLPVAACVGVRARAAGSFAGNLAVGMIAGGGSPVCYPGATITP